MGMNLLGICDSINQGLGDAAINLITRSHKFGCHEETL